ncbi:50S ribosomal protein L25-like [Zingiber officinale]|uniref:50S ribosomal protein L25-like n=1 Tax=Zingiber officinale TaxID=94328 RepID=UPI001C4C6DCB|nr:50S ribosomal protein L25-like [Zingiber officinale]
MARWRRAGAGFLQAASTPLWQGDATHEYHLTIQAVLREYTGSRYAAKQRAAGLIPAAVLTRRHGSDDISNTQLLTTDENQIREILDRSPFFCSTPIKLQVRARPDSTVVLRSGTVLPIQVHKSQETGQIMNLMFEWADEGSVLKVDVPVIFKGEDACPGLKKGGYLHKIIVSLPYLCPSEHIPQKIEVNLTHLDIGDVVLVRDIAVHPSLKLLSEINDKPICKIIATKPDE